MSFIVEVITTQTIAHVHIHYPPWGQNCFLVGIFEAGKQLRNFLDPLRGGKLIGAENCGANAATSGHEDFRVIVFDETFEHLFGDAGGHKFLPGGIVHDIHQLVHGDILVNGNISAVNQQRHTDGNTTQDRNRIVLELLLFLHLFQTLFFIRCTLPFGLFLDAVQLFVFFFGKTLGVDVDFLDLGGCFGCTHNLFQVVEFFNFQLV